jgi:hypothetical protein
VLNSRHGMQRSLFPLYSCWADSHCKGRPLFVCDHCKTTLKVMGVMKRSGFELLTALAILRPFDRKKLPNFEGAYRFCRQNQALQEDCPPFKGRAPCSFETSVTIYQSTRRNDPENINLIKRIPLTFWVYLGAFAKLPKATTSIVIFSLTGAQDSHLQRVTIPEAAYIQLWRRPPEYEQGNGRNM